MITTELKATIQCDGEVEHATGRANWGCVATGTYSVDAESVSLETFINDAAEHFRENGWKMIGGTRCPNCKQYPHVLASFGVDGEQFVVKQISYGHRRIEVESGGHVYAVSWEAEYDDSVDSIGEIAKLWKESRHEFHPFDQSHGRYVLSGVPEDPGAGTR